MVHQPNYKQRPFFSSSFRSSIAVGSYFIFNVGSCGKQRVGRIIEATKADEDDYEVKVNIFIPFDNWKLHQNHFAIGEGIAKGLQEVILTTEISKFLFDRDVEDVAFVFTPEQLEEYGAILQGIDNVFVCRYYDNEEEVKDGDIVPFPSMIKAECPVPRCFLSRLFYCYRNSPLPNLLQPQSKRWATRGAY